jgi:cytoskeletal protein CcmA (bactofilin family)
MFTKNSKTPATPPPEPMQKPVPAQDAIRGAATKPAARAASIICADMKINGSVTSEGALQIDGIVDGDVSATDITIGASGQIIGEVKAEVVKVKGRIKGSIRARKVELETGAHVKGDIVHSSLQIQSNAVFEGQVKHADDPLKETGPVGAASAGSNDSKPAVASSAPGPYSISSSSPPS